MKKHNEEVQIKQNPCLVCKKENPIPYARVKGTDVVCSKKCNLIWEAKPFDERNGYERTL